MTSEMQLRNIIPEQNPYNASNQAVHAQQQQPPPLHLIQTPQPLVDLNYSWNVFKTFGHLYMWEEYVCLYLLALNSEEDISGIEADVDLEITGLHQYIDGLSDDMPEVQLQPNEYKSLIGRYWDSRKTGDVKERNDAMKFVHDRLETWIFSRYKPELVEYLSRMTKYQVQMLRSVFISRIYGYASFIRNYNRHRSLNVQATSNETENRDSPRQESDVENHSIDQIKELKDENQSLKDETQSLKIELEIYKRNWQEEKTDLVDVRVQVNELTKQLRDKEESHQLLEKEIEHLKNQSELTNVPVVRDDKNAKREHNKTRRDSEYVRKAGGKHKQHHDQTRTVSWNNPTKEGERILYQGRKSSRDETKEKSKEELINVTIESPTENENEKLRQENIKLRASLGDITNLEWLDDDENNSMQLVKDIESLCRSLSKITGVKRKAKEIKMDAVAKLFSSFNCTTTVDSKQMKLVLSAALQQHLINFVLRSAEEYFSQPLQDILEGQEKDFITRMTEDKLETVILSRTNDLIKLINRFKETHMGTDEHSQILPIKLRQHIYATLGHRGFSSPNHPFITKLAKNLMDEMNKYRILETEEKIENITAIVYQILRIFYFRLKTQEPIPSIEFYQSGKDIDPVFMEGTWEGYYEDHEVEICSFPVVYTKSDERVYTKAQVIARQKRSA